MAKLPTRKRILTETFPEQEEWIPQLLSPLNQFMEDVERALNQQLTFAQNLSSEVKTITVDGTYPMKLAWPLRQKPIAAWIGQCREIDGNHTVFTDPLYLDWEFNAAGQFQINKVVGLSDSQSNKYNLTYIAITG